MQAEYGEVVYKGQGFSPRERTIPETLDEPFSAKDLTHQRAL